MSRRRCRESLFLKASIIWNDSDAPEGYSYGLYPDGSWDHLTLEITNGDKNELVDFFSQETVDDLYINISEEGWNNILDRPLAKEYQPASITYRNVTLKNVAFRTKGNSSLQNVANSGQCGDS